LETSAGSKEEDGDEDDTNCEAGEVEDDSLLEELVFVLPMGFSAEDNNTGPMHWAIASTSGSHESASDIAEERGLGGGRLNSDASDSDDDEDEEVADAREAPPAAGSERADTDAAEGGESADEVGEADENDAARWSASAHSLRHSG
jgi:hypothetical protein